MLRFATVGAGRAFTMYARALVATAGASLVAVVDPSARRDVGVPLFRDIDACLASVDIDAALVLTPVQAHVPAALRLVRAGKHVIVEKPVSMDGSGIAALGRAARQAGVTVWPAHTYVYDPALASARDLIRHGELGAVGFACLTYLKAHDEDMSRLFPDVLAQHSTHLLYTALFLLGRPSAVSCRLTQRVYRDPGRYDQAALTLTYGEGCICQINTSIAVDGSTAPTGIIRFEVTGDRGRFDHSWTGDVVHLLGGEAVGARYAATFPILLERFVRCLGGDPDAEPLSTLADAADAERIRRAALRSAHDATVVDISFD